jgi:integrase
MGCIYRRGKIYWVKYYRNGKPYAESSHSDKQEVAKRLLKIREGEISRGKLPGICFDRIRFDELVEDYLTDYRINNKRTLGKAERCARYLLEEFGGMRTTDITTPIIKQYIQKRMDEGISNATINRELAALKRTFNLAARCTPPRVAQIPYIPMLKETNVRKGFFEHETFLALKETLPTYLKPVVSFAYSTGWRKEEIAGLQWDQVDLREGIVRIEPGETKNQEGRTIYLEPELLEMMKGLHRERRLGCPYVFHLKGRKIGDFRVVWRRACREAEVPGMLFHDFRRTAIRNMIRAGIPERVAMAISGHKTRGVFDRYNIVSQDDLKEAARKRQAFNEKQAERLQFSYSRPKTKKKLTALNSLSA